MFEKFSSTNQPTLKGVSSLQSADERVWFENELIRNRQRLKKLPNSTSNFERAQIELEIAQALIGLDRLKDAWESARPLVELFITEKQYPE